MEIFFRLNCLSTDFPRSYAPNNPTVPAILLGPYGEPFKVTILSELKSTDYKLDHASFQLYSFEKNAVVEKYKPW